MNNRPIIYIAGPISGQPDLNRAAFYHAQEQINAMGFEVRNPHEFCRDIVSDDPSDAAYYKRGLQELMNCTDILLLPTWEYSTGAQLEAKAATVFKMQVHHSVEDIIRRYESKSKS